MGNNTEKAIQSGIYFGYKNAVSGVINEIFKKHSLNKKNTQILTTGIYANLLDNNEFEFVEEEMLGLEGLKIIYDLNKNKAS